MQSSVLAGGRKCCGKEFTRIKTTAEFLHNFEEETRRGEVAVPSSLVFSFRTSSTDGHWRPGGPSLLRGLSFTWLLSVGWLLQQTQTVEICLVLAARRFLLQGRWRSEFIRALFEVEGWRLVHNVSARPTDWHR